MTPASAAGRLSAERAMRRARGGGPGRRCYTTSRRRSGSTLDNLPVLYISVPVPPISIKSLPILTMLQSSARSAARLASRASTTHAPRVRPPRRTFTSTRATSREIQEAYILSAARTPTAKVCPVSSVSEDLLA